MRVTSKKYSILIFAYKSLSCYLIYWFITAHCDIFPAINIYKKGYYTQSYTETHLKPAKL